MSGRIIVVQRYNRQMIRKNPNKLFVFGDNLARKGYGGQAASARGEPNAVGIVTKLSPYEYLSDYHHFHRLREPIRNSFARLALHLTDGYDVVWPADGVGTGLANLENAAPEIAAGIERCRDYLFMQVAGIKNIHIL